MRYVYKTKGGTPILIAHFPGWTRDLYRRDMDRMKKNKITIPDNIQVITCVDDDSVNFDKSPLIEQLNYNNIPFINAAEHKDVYPWVNNKKIKLLCDALESVPEDKEYCLILDGLDVCINDSLDNIVELFNKYNKDIIYNASQWAYPNVEVETIENRKEIYGQFCYLNAGCCIGKREALIKFYKEVLKIFNETSKDDEFYHSEQYFVRKAFAKNFDKVWFDNKCSIFQVFHKIEFKIPIIDKETGDIVYQIK